MTAQPNHSPHPWSKDALLAKAQRYAEQMDDTEQDDWRFLLWSTLTLELLARAALAHISPVLLAEGRDWNNVYFALGHEPRVAKFTPRSIDISSVLAHLRDSVAGLDSRLERFAWLHMQRRNEELHSGALMLDDIKSSSWLPTFYETCAALLDSIGEDLQTLFDGTTVEAAYQMINAARDQSAKAVKGTIAKHQEIWGKKGEEEHRRLSAQSAIWATRHGGHRVQCPACHSHALVTGQPAAPPQRSLQDDMIVTRQSFAPVRFECIACGLKILGLPQLLASGVGDNYTTTATYDPADYYAPEPDPYDGFEEDNNEPF